MKHRNPSYMEKVFRKQKRSPERLPDGGNGKDHGDKQDREGGLKGVQLVASIQFPTRFGQFVLFGFYDRDGNKEHTAVVKGSVEGKENCPVRIHSQCHTGDVLGSLRCDCGDQLEAALSYIQGQPYGAVLYMQQEGRGIGLMNKIKAYQLQDQGYDTVEANKFLGFPADARDYRIAARILELLGIRSLKLITNNPDKIQKLKSLGVNILGRIPIVTEENKHNRYYLKTRKVKMGHLF